MGPQFPGGRRELAFGGLGAEFWIGYIISIKIGISEVKADFRCMVQFVRRQIVAKPVPAVVGKPQFPGNGMPIKSYRVTHSPGKNRQVPSIGVHFQDRRKTAVGFLAYVARGAHRDIEFAIRAEADKLPSVPPFLREGVVHDFRFPWCIKMLHDVPVSGHAGHFCDVKVAVLECNPVGHGQTATDDNDFIRLEITILIHYGIDVSRFSGSHKNSSRRAGRHGPGIGYVCGIQMDLKARRQGNFF